ncbi:MAG: 6-bladed beta-propeller [Tannerellaceae bacterium]|jgi:hypothetical protein|nr:6-bladed beta-propeller [Tannerellaceae bacterium]
MNSKSLIQVLIQIVCVFIVASCSTSEDSLIVFDIDKATISSKQFNLSSIANSVEYVCLETKDECLINEASIVYIGVVNNNFLIADLNGCYMFDSGGRFIKQVGRKGEGPAEHANIGTVFYDEKTKSILISSTYSYADGILVFDEKGNYKKTLLSNTRLPDWTILNDSIIVSNIPNYLGNSVTKAAFISLNGDTLSTVANDDHFRMNGSVLNLNNRAVFYTNSNNKYYMRNFNDTIYLISYMQKLIPKYVVSSSDHKASNELRADGNKFANTDFDYIIPWSIIETDRFLFVNMFRNKEGLVPYFYDKKNEEFFSIAKSIKSDLYGFTDDLTGNILSFFPQYQLSDNLVCAVLSPNTILELKKKFPDTINLDFCYLNEYSNPVLSIIKITTDRL